MPVEGETTARGNIVLPCKREGAVMRKPSFFKGSGKTAKRHHCQHISQRVSQSNRKTVPTVPLFVSSVSDRLCKRDAAKFSEEQNQLLGGTGRGESEIFWGTTTTTTYPHYLSPTSSANGGAARRGNGIPFTCHQVTLALESRRRRRRRRPTTLPAGCSGVLLYIRV